VEKGAPIFSNLMSGSECTDEKRCALIVKNLPFFKSFPIELLIDYFKNKRFK